MSVLRNDLTEMRGIYQITGHDGNWRVYAYNDQPVITMCNMESGKLLDMPAVSQLNQSTTFLRYIDEHDVIMDAEITEPTFVDVDGIGGDVQLLSQDDYSEIASDFVLLVGELLKAGKLTKDIKDKLASVHEMASSVININQ